MRNLIFGICSYLLACSSIHSANFDRPASWQNINHIIIVVLENTDYKDAIKQDFLGTFAHKGALLTESHGVRHPSQPNYIALVSGSTHGVDSDNNVDLDVAHLGDLLEGAQKSWKVYAEGYPGNEYLGATYGKYARKHVPFLSFTNVQKSSARMANIVPAWQLYLDQKYNALPNFSLIIPDLDNDGHNTNVERASDSMETFLGSILNDPEIMKDTVVIITFDEDADKFTQVNHIYTAFTGAGVIQDIKSMNKYNHYNILRTVEEIFQLGTVGQNDQTAMPITEIWQ